MRFYPLGMKTMYIGRHNLSQDLFFIAEIGNNHEGSVVVAERLIRAAATTGVEAVKFQTFITEHFINPEQQERFEKLKRFELTFKEFEHLAKVSRDEGLIFLSTPFDLESAEFLNDLVPAFKIGSSENSHYPLLRKVASFDKPLLISTGLLRVEEVEDLLQFLSPLLKQRVDEQVILLHCVTQYPTPPDRAHLRRIIALRQHFPNVIGYSDHVIGINAALCAIALGSRVVEKHFTLDHNYSSFRDHQLSATPEEMKLLVHQGREFQSYMTTLNYFEEQSSQLVPETVRRSIIARRDMRKGEVIKEEDLGWTRPAGGLMPGQESLLVGKMLKQDVRSGQRIFTSDVD
jgi:N,N'-diacetyllegionaminate synthase